MTLDTLLALYNTMTMRDTQSLDTDTDNEEIALFKVRLYAAMSSMLRLTAAHADHAYDSFSKDHPNSEKDA